MRLPKPFRRIATSTACLLLIAGSSGCASMLETAVRGVAEHHAGPPRGRQLPPRGPGSVTGRTLDSGPDAPTSTRSGYQVAPTPDWHTSRMAHPFTPGRAWFDWVGPQRVVCQAVPAGIGEVFSGPTGAAATPIADLGFADFGLAGPHGAYEDVFATGGERLKSRALRSGARMIGAGPVCGTKLFLFMRLGPGQDPVTVYR